MPDFIAADTAVISRLTKSSEDSHAYNDFIGERRLAISFQSEAELVSADFGPRRRQRLNDLLAAMVKLPHTAATNAHYAVTARVRSELRKKQFAGGGAQDGDVWIISSALEHGISLLSHDIQQVHLGRAVGLRVLTNLPGLKEQNPDI